MLKVLQKAEQVVDMTTFRGYNVHRAWTMGFRPVGQQVTTHDADETHSDLGSFTPEHFFPRSSLSL